MNPSPLPLATAIVGALLPAPDPFTSQPLTGDAGNRCYHRIHQGNQRYVLMEMADPEGFKASEEATAGLSAEVPDELPFLNMHRHLERAGLPVPAVIATDLAHGLILLEDLGDTPLMDLAHAGEAACTAAYREAVDHLCDLQRMAVPADCVAHHRHYTADLLRWEFDHYLEYGIEALHHTPLSAATRAALGSVLGRVAEQIAAGPQVLVHRDYHSRNLMVRRDGGDDGDDRDGPGGDRLAMIDFQDALMGPATYDLASLLWDPYVTLSPPLTESLMAQFRAGTPVSLEADFVPLLRRTALQRLLKAAGRFVYIDRVKGNPAFLDSIAPCLSRAAQLLAADPELAPVAEILIPLEPRLAVNAATSNP